MKILYIANARIPTEKAHGYQIMKMCQAFTEQGVRVSLWVPKRKNPIDEDPFEFYQIRPTFPIKRLWSLDLMPWFRGPFLRLAFWLQNLTFVLSSYAKIFQARDDIIFTRDAWSAWFLSKVHENVFYEMHDFPRSKLIYRGLFKKIKGLVSTNFWKAEQVKRIFNFPDEKILVAFNGVDFNAFQVFESREEAGAKLGLPNDKKIILYTGHLYSWKGVDVLAKAVDYLSDDVLVVFVGGTEKDVAGFTKEYVQKNKRIRLIGHRPHKEIPLYLRAADVLVLPNTAKEKISLTETSPLKIFEYLASGTPVVASDIPSIREVVKDNIEVLLFKPDNSRDLAVKIKKLLDNYDLAKKMGDRGRDFARENTWARRVEKILTFMSFA
ncbi:glycosyltransferase family 4 protein [Patescibacteria group bacterium]|nr:glycosyltransferase family 4 protein [Patescibacteria group bacterium]